MTSGFGALYYTDCRPGQGLLPGGAGFQFQATSDDVPPQAAVLVQRMALYEPPVTWMRDRRPVADYPTSLAHAVDGDLYVTSAGRYLGVEANGSREGNQFTHAVATTESSSYGLARPAQLWGAPWWAHAPAPTTRIDGLAAAPPTGPWNADLVRDRVAAAPDAEQWLTVLLSALHLLDGPDRRPILMISGDPEEVVCWIAAATLLIPQERALRIAFKIFAADLQHSSHDIVALHPDWAGRWSSTSDGGGFVVFDLAGHRHTEVPATEDARYWVPRFLRADPFDVVDAVEYSARFATARRPGGADVDPAIDRIAGAIVALDEPVTSIAEARTLADWLAGAPPEAVGQGADRVIEAIMAAAPADGETLLHLCAIVARRGPQTMIDRTTAGLLEAEISEVFSQPEPAAAAWVAELQPLTVGRNSEAANLRRQVLVEQALAAARPTYIAALLGLATRHRLRPRPGYFAASTSAFAEWWLDHPQQAQFRNEWTIASDVKDWLRSTLTARLAGGDPQVEGQIDRYWWKLLWPTVVFPGDALDMCLCGRAYEHARPADRPAVLRDVLRRCVELAGVDAGGTAWNAVFRYRTSTDPLEEVEDFLIALAGRNQPIGTALAEAIIATLDSAGPPTKVGFRIVGRITEAGHTTPALQSWFEHDRVVTSVVQRLPLVYGWDAGVELAHVLNGADLYLQELHADELVRALLATDVMAAFGMLTGSAKPQCEFLLRMLRGHWPDLGKAPVGPSARAVALAYVFVDSHGGGKPSLDPAVVRTPLQILARSLPRKGRAAVNRAYPEELGKPWTDWLKANDEVGDSGRGLTSLFRGPKRQG